MQIKKYINSLHKEDHKLLISIISDLKDDTFRKFFRTDLIETIIDIDYIHILPNEFGHVVFQYVAKVIGGGYLYISLDKFYLSIEYDLRYDLDPIELIYENYQDINSLYKDIINKVYEFFRLIGVINE